VPPYKLPATAWTLTRGERKRVLYSAAFASMKWAAAQVALGYFLRNPCMSTEISLCTEATNSCV
jgi:hypothetical protein